MKLDPAKMAFMQEQTEKTQRQTIESYRRLNKIAKKGQILFTGSSLMEQFPIAEMARSHGFEKTIYNRGVGGFTTTDFLANIDTMLLDLKPSYVFINIGTNDLADLPDGTSWKDRLNNNYDRILEILKENLPDAEVYMMAYYPMDDDNEEAKFFAEYFGAIRSNRVIAEANDIAKKLADKHGFRFIDVNEGLTDDKGNLKKEFCKDAIHFYPDGYEAVYKNLEKYLMELESR